MAIATLDQYIAASKQRIPWHKTASRTSVAAMGFSAFDLAGNPGAGVLAIGNTANGIVPTSATAGYPSINTFGGGATGYITKMEFGSTVACRLTLYDRLFSAGAYSFNSDVTLASQPSYSARLPGTDYKGLELWAEMVTASTLNQAIQIYYTDDTGATGHTTGAVGIGAAPTVGRMWQLPLAAGDRGVQMIERVVGTVASAGTWNVHVMRRLWSGRVASVAAGDVHDLLRTGMPIIYATSALFMVVTADSTATGIPETIIEVANA